MRIELFKYRFYEDSILSLEPLNASEQKSSVKVKADNILKSPVDYSVDALLKKAPESIVEIFNDLRSKIFEIDENIIEKATSLYIAYRVANSFAEIWLYKKQLKIYLRPIEYNDPEKKVEKISAGYKWKLDKLIIVKELSEVDYAISIIEQSYQDVL
jgi:predicted transport protein